MSENSKLVDCIDFEEIKQHAKAARAEYLRQHRASALVVVGSTFAIMPTLLLFGPRTHSDQLMATAKMQKVVTHGAPVARH